NENARFWVVRPRVGLSGISGLSTLLSGSYIEVSGLAGGGVPRRHFTGLENPPLTPEGAPGMRLRLSAQEAGSMTAGSPVFYRRVVVGRVESRWLSNDGDQVELDIFIDAPYHVLVNSNTRFWDASGFDITLDTEGVTLRSETMEAVITGGVAFSNPPRLQAGSPVSADVVFTLHESREEAARAPAGGLANRLGLVLYFDESLHGLKVGAPVEFRGVEIGYVADISIEYSGDTREVKVPVLIFIEPHRIRGLSGAENAETALPTAVEHGLRARLQTGSLITGQLFVELVNLDDAEPASLEQSGQYAIFPTVPSPFAEISGSASVILTKLRDLPVDELVATAIRVLDNMDALIGTRPTAVAGPASDPPVDQAGDQELDDTSLRRMVAQIHATLEKLNTILSSPGVTELPQELGRGLRELNEILTSTSNLLEGDAGSSRLYYDISSTLHELTRAAQAVRILTETLEDKPNAVIFGR
ncbi:MAG: MlaD family protein, partial [Pseudomonadota bacterium]